MRKKVISVLLAGLLAIGLTGCQGSGEPKKKGQRSKVTAAGIKYR